MEKEIIMNIYNKENELVNTFYGKSALKSLLSYCYDKAVCNAKSYDIDNKVSYTEKGETYSIVTITFDSGYKYIWENVKTDSVGRIETTYINEILG